MFFRRLCLSITDFHPDTWNPAWSVSTILTGLLSFMVEKGPTLGSIETSDYTVRLHTLRTIPNEHVSNGNKVFTCLLFLFLFRKDSCPLKVWPSISRTKSSVNSFLM